jgi:hypothetical protein
MTADAALTALDEAIARSGPEERPALVAALATRLETLGKLLANTPEQEAGEGGWDQNLSADEAAARLGLSKVYLYRHTDRLPFARRIGRRVVFSAKGLERWSQQQRSSR